MRDGARCRIYLAAFDTPLEFVSGAPQLTSTVGVSVIRYLDRLRRQLRTGRSSMIATEIDKAKRAGVFSHISAGNEAGGPDARTARRGNSRDIRG